MVSDTNPKVARGVAVKVLNAGVGVAVSHQHNFEIGSIVISKGVDFGKHHLGEWALFADSEGVTQWLLPQHYEVIGVEKVVELEKKVEKVVEKVVDKTIPTKAVYAVVDVNGSIFSTTDDREQARELKSALGGKRKGVRIFQYTTDKEIR